MSPNNASTNHDSNSSVEAHYAENNNFYIFATPEDLPSTLVWQNGQQLPEFSSQKAEKGGTLTEGIPEFPRTLRFVGPDTNRGFKDYLLKIAMQYAHKHPNADDYYPGLAKEWALEPEKNRVFIRLDPEAKWSDGTPITTDDALYAFYFYRSPHIHSPLHAQQYKKRYKSITRYDPHTFSITTRKSQANPCTHTLTLAPVPKHFFGTLNENFVQKYQWEFAPTSGAYEIRKEDITKGRMISLRRLENWWAKDNRFWRNRFNIDTLNFQIIRNTSKLIESLNRGDIDICGLNQSANWYERVPDDSPNVKNGYIRKIIFYNDIPRPNIGIWINSAKPLLENKQIRQGLQHACNWDLVIEQFFRGDYQRLRTTSDGHGVYTHPTLKPRDYSAQKALDSFARAGFTTRGYDGILTNDRGQRLSFTITAGFDMFGDLLAILKQEAVKAGVEIRIEILDISAGWKKIQEKKHELALTAFFHEPRPYPQYEQFFHSVYANKPQTNNITNLKSPVVDRLIDAYTQSTQETEIKTLAHEIEEALHEEAVFIPGYKQPYYRYGIWRWVSYPEGFNVRSSQYPNEYFIHWIDPKIKAETLEAKLTQKSFEPQILTFDQYRVE